MRRICSYSHNSASDLCSEVHQRDSILQEKKQEVTDIKRRVLHLKACGAFSLIMKCMCSTPYQRLLPLVLQEEVKIDWRALVMKTKKACCAVLTRAISSCFGNDTTSALNNILKLGVTDHPSATNFILWRDTCVPHGCDQMMSYCLQHQSLYA